MAAPGSFDPQLTPAALFSPALDALAWFDEELTGQSPVVLGVRLGIYDPELEPQAWFHPSIDPVSWFDDDLINGMAVAPIQGAILQSGAFAAPSPSLAGQLVTTVRRPIDEPGGGFQPLVVRRPVRRRRLLAGAFEAPSPRLRGRLQTLVPPPPAPIPPPPRPVPIPEPIVAPVGAPELLGTLGVLAPTPYSDKEIPAPRRRLAPGRFLAPVGRLDGRLELDDRPRLRRALREDLELLALLDGDPEWLLVEDLVDA